MQGSTRQVSPRRSGVLSKKTDSCTPLQKLVVQTRFISTSNKSRPHGAPKAGTCRPTWPSRLIVHDSVGIRQRRVSGVRPDGRLVAFSDTRIRSWSCTRIGRAAGPGFPAAWNMPPVRPARTGFCLPRTRSEAACTASSCTSPACRWLRDGWPEQACDARTWRPDLFLAESVRCPGSGIRGNVACWLTGRSTAPSKPARRPRP